MKAFGKCDGGGRRHASREHLQFPALVSTIQDDRVLVLVDLSSTGARLRGPDLPPVGEAVSLKVDYVRAFGTVAWLNGGECGVDFDSPIQSFQIARLSERVKVATFTAGGVEQQLGLQDWLTGFAR
jgi:hypothetical protein